MPRRSCRGFSARRAPWAVPRLVPGRDAGCGASREPCSGRGPTAIAQERSCSTSMCRISCLRSKRQAALQNQNRERTTQRGTLEMGQGCSLGREARRTVPCGSILLCTPCETLCKGAAPPATDGASVKYLSPKRQHVPSQTCVRLRSTAWRACSPDADGRGTGQFPIHDCLCQAQSTPRRSPQSTCAPRARTEHREARCAPALCWRRGNSRARAVTARAGAATYL